MCNLTRNLSLHQGNVEHFLFTFFLSLGWAGPGGTTQALGLVRHDLPRAPANNLNLDLHRHSFGRQREKEKIKNSSFPGRSPVCTIDSNWIIDIQCLVILTLCCRLFGFPYLVSDTSQHRILCILASPGLIAILFPVNCCHENKIEKITKKTVENRRPGPQERQLGHKIISYDRPHSLQ